MTRGAVLRLTVGLLACVALCAGCSAARGTSTARSVPRSRSAKLVAPLTFVPAIDRPAPAPVAKVLSVTRGGTLREVTIPAAVGSGYQPRPAYVYVPPIVRTQPHRRLPVIELLHGTPGSPEEWVTRGDMLTTLDAFARAHGGWAPIVVAPDINGAGRADSECVRTRTAQVESYLLSTVPNWISTHYATMRRGAGWSVAGLSEGGTCATMLTLRAPTLFHTFGDFSGLARPTVGSFDNPLGTLETYFGGSQPAYDLHDPIYLLTHRRYPGIAGWFRCGAQDRAPLRDQRELATLASRAGVFVVQSVVPGAHSWKVWGPAFRDFLSWWWNRLAGAHLVPTVRWG